MAVPARSLTPAGAPILSPWPWHVPLVGSVRASLLRTAQRRMEAESYLADGYGIRLAIESKPSGWVRFGTVASASAPPRIKQILVSPEYGVPYLNTSQVFDIRPTPRKWLAMGKTTKAEERLVKEGTILVMASATVGRAIMATKAHENKIISHHFMRIEPTDKDLSGWVYAFLRSNQAKSMMSGSQYASVIRHIEPLHIETLPVPKVSRAVAEDFQAKAQAIVVCRNNATSLRSDAEAMFADAVGDAARSDGEAGFSVSVTEVTSGRRRFEAAYHSPHVLALIRSFKRWEPLGKITRRIWWPNRFKRQFGESGTPYMSADDVFTMNPYALKSVLVEGKKDRDDFMVEPGWIVMARSGQIYGLNGSAMLVTDYHKGFFLSDDLIRILPDSVKARSGYLLTALTHPTFGRPLVIREAYGMSIPHLDPDDVAAIPVMRLDKRAEDDIADLAEKASSEQARAEMLEREIAEAATNVVSDFLMRPSLCNVSEDEADVEIARRLMAEIDAHPERVLRGPELEARMIRWQS